MIFVFIEIYRPLLFCLSFKRVIHNYSFFFLQKIDKEEFSKYKLYGVIVHIGGMDSGHYYTYVKSLKSLRTDEWEKRDDSFVKKVELASVLKCNAYILFYHKSIKVTELP